MVYRKYNKRANKRYKKRYNKRNPASSSGNNVLRQVGSVASTALNIAKFAASVLNVEDKYKLTSFNASVSSTAPAQVVLNGINQGTDNTERIGRQIRLKSIHWRAVFTKNASLATQQLAYYVVIDKKHDGGGVYFPVTDYLTSANEISFRNPDYNNRFQTIKRACLTFTDSGMNKVHCIDEYIDLTDLGALAKTEYKGITAALNDISAFPVYILCVSSTPNSNPIDLRSECRVKYIDN